MESLVDEKDHARPAHNALNTDTVKKSAEDDASRRMNEVANKAAGKGLERERQDDKPIFSK